MMVKNKIIRNIIIQIKLIKQMTICFCFVIDKECFDIFSNLCASIFGIFDLKTCKLQERFCMLNETWAKVYHLNYIDDQNLFWNV